jgi:hypothetical protein
VKDPATLNVFEIQIVWFTEWSNAADVPPNCTFKLEFDVAATPPDRNHPVPLIVAFVPPGAPVVRTVSTSRRLHGPDREDAGTVWAIDAPRVVPDAFVVLILGETVRAPVAAVVIRPPASTIYIFPGLASYAKIGVYCWLFHMPTAVVAAFAARGSVIAGSTGPASIRYWRAI